MLKQKWEKRVAVGLGLFIFGGGLVCCSGIHFPFFQPWADLDGHLREDFGVGLPATAKMREAYWVGYRDPEHVYKVEMDAGEVGKLMEALRASARGRGIEEKSGERHPRFGPLYRMPPWWNNPPLVDAVKVEFMLMREGWPTTDYRIIYSPVERTVYVVWGTD